MVDRYETETKKAKARNSSMQDFSPLSLVLFTLLARLKSPFPFLSNACHALPSEKKMLLKASILKRVAGDRREARLGVSLFAH